MRSLLGFAFIICGALALASAYFGYGVQPGRDDDIIGAIIGSALFVGGCALIGPQPSADRP